jgi:hypothetical protein
MSELKIERHEWEGFPVEIHVIDDMGRESFELTFKEGEPDLEIEFTWEYGYGGRGTGRTYLPIETLKSLIAEIESKTKNTNDK